MALQIYIDALNFAASDNLLELAPPVGTEGNWKACPINKIERLIKALTDDQKSELLSRL